MIVVYGLKNCETCRKAMKWLAAEGIEARLHDMRADGLDAAMLEPWIAAFGWEALLNRRGTTWRGLPDAEKEGLDAERAKALMLRRPALIKRPVFDAGGRLVLGFTDAQRAAIRAAAAVSS